MKIKRIGAVCVITFLVGGLLGGGYAYVTHSGSGEEGLLVSLEQAQEHRELEQFIQEQEKLHPDGLTESNIAAGSKYTGITYNNVVPQSAPQQETDSAETPQLPTEEKKGLLGNLFQKTQSEQQKPEEQRAAQQNKTGFIAIQSGSLNVRSSGSMNGSVIGQVYKDDQVEILGQSGAWYQIRTQAGLEGYVSTTYVTVQ